MAPPLPIVIQRQDETARHHLPAPLWCRGPSGAAQVHPQPVERDLPRFYCGRAFKLLWFAVYCSRLVVAVHSVF